jgi:hypothetical protein
LIKHSTSSFFQRHFFDDIQITNYVPDVTPPTIQTATATSLNNVDVLFSEPVETSSSQLLSNYSVNNNLGNPSTPTLDGANPALVHLTFATALTNAVAYTLTVNGVKGIK